MKRLIDFIMKFGKKESLSIFERSLGRWNIDYCKNKMGRKIDLANEDHCGTCGEYMGRRLVVAEKQKETALK